MQEKAEARREAEDHAYRDHLGYWYQQEVTPLDDGDPGYRPAANSDDQDDFVAGWWIVPTLALSVLAWVSLIAFIAG